MIFYEFHRDTQYSEVFIIIDTVVEKILIHSAENEIWAKEAQSRQKCLHDLLFISIRVTKEKRKMQVYSFLFNLRKDCFLL